MKDGRSMLTGVRLAGLAAVFVSAISCAGATKTAAPAASGDELRTPWGEPNLQGVWRNDTATPTQRPANEDRAELTPEEIAARQQTQREQEERINEGIESRTGRGGDPIRGVEYNRFWQNTGKPNTVLNRTSLIIDPPNGRMPLTPEARKKTEMVDARYGIGPYLNYLDPDTGERCLTDGLAGSMLGGTAGAPVEFVQSPGYVTILYETYEDDRRIIPTDGREHGKIRSWFGDSVGHWEGDTLVVDTTNLVQTPDDYWWVNTWREPSETMHLVEKFQRVDPNTLNYTMTVEDPSKFTQPWTLDVPLTKLAEERFEYACHEGNYAMVHILTETRNTRKK